MEKYYIIVDNLHFLLLTSLTAYCYCYFVKQFMKSKKHVWFIGVAYFILLVSLYYSPFVFSNLLVYGAATFIGLLVMSALDRNNFKQKIFLSVTFFSLRWLSVELENCLDKVVYQNSLKLPGLQHKPKLQFYVFTGEVCIDLILTFLFLFLSVWIIRKEYVYKKENMTNRELVMLLIPSFAGIIEYGVLKYYNTIYQSDTGKSLFDIYGTYNWLCFIQYGVSLATIVILIVLFQNIKGKKEEEKRNDNLKEQIADMEKHIAEVEILYQDMRSLKHDMGNHVMMLEKLCMKNEYNEAQKYMTQLRTEFQTVAREIKSGNPVTDVILEEKRKEAKEKQIAFICEFYYPKNTNLNAFDIAVLLNNALANAIEAALNSSHPYVQVTSYRNKNAYMIEVKNSYSGIRVMDEECGLPLTTKKREQGHGYGLVNIQKVARNYFGDIDIEQDGESFVLSIMLMIE